MDGLARTKAFAGSQVLTGAFSVSASGHNSGPHRSANPGSFRGDWETSAPQPIWVSPLSARSAFLVSSFKNTAGIFADFAAPSRLGAGSDLLRLFAVDFDVKLFCA